MTESLSDSKPIQLGNQILRPQLTGRDLYRHCAPGRFRVRLDISYDGANYSGWQKQVDSVGNETQPTIQGELEKAVRRLFGEPLSVVGASRTDAGVHAQMQVAHFDCGKDPRLFKDLRYTLQRLTPPDIVIKRVYLASPNFHSIATVNAKTYRYSILNRTTPSALRYKTTWWVRRELDLNWLKAAADELVGEHDFKSFQTSGTPVDSTVRTIYSAHWDRSLEHPDTLIFTIRGNGFLKQMVRNVVGTCVDFAKQSRGTDAIRDLIAHKDRRKAGQTAPAHALFLAHMEYPAELDNQLIPL